MNPESYKSLVETPKGSIIELNRLWIDDCLGRNAETILLGACWKIIKANYPHIKFVQSFADGRLGCGTIYKASNFKYYGYSYTEFFEYKDSGEITHNVNLNSFDRRPVIQVNVDHLTGNLKPFKVRTYRYIYPLYKNRYKVKLKEKPYPEYNKGIEYLDDYKFSVNHYVKLMILYDYLNRQDLVQLARSFIPQVDDEKIEQLKAELKENKWIKRLLSFTYPSDYI